MYDYIIIGGGTAGCVLANRLSENPDISVLLLEAGSKDNKKEVRIPAAFSKMFKTSLDWEFYTPPQPDAGGRKMYLPRGKMLGGCSSINAMIYIRGNKLDYDHWKELGNTGWGYNDVLPYFKRSEAQQRISDSYHGVDGPMVISDLQEPYPVTKAFVQAGQELGYPANPDFNGASQEGFGIYQVNQQTGRRHSVVDAFLKPARNRKNLKIMTHAEVKQIIVRYHKATGVRVVRPSGTLIIQARKEVILCAGAYNSPQLLMLSGIGDGETLQSWGIPVQQHLPGVGKNLQDHLVVPMIYYNKQQPTLDDAEGMVSLVNYLMWAEGPLTSNIAEAGGFIRTRPELAAPDIQYHFAPGFFLNHGFDNPKEGNGFSYAPTLLQPESIGEVRLQSRDFRTAPVIDHRYFSNERDVETLIAGFRTGLQLLRTSALKPYFNGYYYPSKKLEQAEDIDQHIRESAQTLYHPVGTCKMGMDPDSVVDARLRVHGIENLRVIDASVMPKIVRGNTHAPVLMIAEKGADLIKQRLETAYVERIKVREKSVVDN